MPNTGFEIGGDGNSSCDSSCSSWEEVGDEDPEYVSKKVMDSCPHSLFVNSLILEKIFDFLPVSDLKNCRLVCREWNRTALLRRLIGSKVEIKITESNFDKLLRLAQTCMQPFCRRFDFQLVLLETEKVSKFIGYFGERVNRLSIKFCTTPSPSASSSSIESVIRILCCPRLEELIIFGALAELQEESFLFQTSFTFTRLKAISLNASLDDGQVSRAFIKALLSCAPNLQTVKIGYKISLWLDFCSALNDIPIFPKLCHLEFLEMEAPLQTDLFKTILDTQKHLQKISFFHCFITQEFVEDFLLQTQKQQLQLSVLKIVGTQQEILTKAFSMATTFKLTELCLPIDGFGVSDGSFVLNSCPNLKTLKVTGLFQTTFNFIYGEDGMENSLNSVNMDEMYQSSSTSVSHFSAENTMTLILEKRREFLKVINLLDAQPSKLELKLAGSNTKVSSRCLRAIYKAYPSLQELRILHNSAKDLIGGFTGIPCRLYRRIAYCRSFTLADSSPSQFKLFPGIETLSGLKHLELAMLDGESPNAELTLVLLVYGICRCVNLEYLSLTNFTISDVSLMVLTQRLPNLSSCMINGSGTTWLNFQARFKQHVVKSFFIPPLPLNDRSVRDGSTPSPAYLVGTSSQLLVKILNCLDYQSIFALRTICKHWHGVILNYLHQPCCGAVGDNLTDGVKKCLKDKENEKTKVQPGQTLLSPLRRYQQKIISVFPEVLELWKSLKNETATLGIVTLPSATLESIQLIKQLYQQHRLSLPCHQRKVAEYWYYPDGTDELVYHHNTDVRHIITTLLAVGAWSRKDDALLKLLNPSLTISTVHLIGLQKETLDMILPKMTQMVNLESLFIKPFNCNRTATGYCELTKTHLQILCNALFKLTNLSMQLHAPSEAVVEFVRSQRFTLESLEIHSIVNMSDRLTFSMPQLKILQLDEPPGCLLWTTLNIHSSLKTIGFGRQGISLGNSPGKNKSSPKMINQLENDFEHSATDILCDVNWFLENAATPASSCRSSPARSILQQGSDSALKFFTHFPYLTSLTLRGVHAHYGILQGIFRKFPQLTKLELIGATGVTDEILTGFSKQILDEMDIMNPFQHVSSKHHDKKRSERPGKSSSANIRNLKRLTHLHLDDQPNCTDFSIIFGILKLSQLKIFSCQRWKISDISVRALADCLPSLKEVNTKGCSTVSKYALEYFKESRIQQSKI